MPIPIQEEPESTIGRKPAELKEDHASRTREHVRSGAAIRAEEGDETEHAGEIRERERDEPPPVPGTE